MSSPLLGYNTNVRHKGKLYHIQTEDSGLQHPHVITHLFADGGRIIASKKTSYAEYVGQEELKDTVKRLMREQHKAMFIALRDGVYDEEEEAGESEGTQSLDDASAVSTSGAPPDPEARADQQGGMDPDALERAAERLSQNSPAHTPTHGDEAKAAGAGSGSGQQAADPSSRLSQPPRPAPTPGSTDRRRSAPSGPGRYQSTQPPQDGDRPDPQSESIFGKDLFTEKSLDEVILSYLAEDLEDPDEG